VKVIAVTLVTFLLGVTLSVLVVSSASASSPLPLPTTTSASTPTSTTSTSTPGLDPNSPAALFSVINATVNAASDHEIVGSSAFPNYTTGAVDNYYAMAHSHVDNSPFAEGTASPADTGPIGQTAAAGNFQQSQYADARWPGGPDNASYGSQGGPFATADAGEFRATADASEATNRLVGPGLGMPKGLDARLQQALAAWKAKWLGPLTGKSPLPKVAAPKTGVPTPAPPSVPGVTTPVPAVTTPPLPVPVPAPALPSVGATSATRSVASANAPTLPPLPSLPSASSSGDGEALLASSTHAALVDADGKVIGDTTKADKSKAYSLLTSGESSLGRVTLGGGQIVIKGIHVTAAIQNDGSAATPTYKASVSIGEASIAGVPVTIDEDGVHVAGQGQGLPYAQASDGLNGALKQAGIQLFLVAPQVTACPQTSTATGTTTTTTTTTTTSSDQSGTTNACDQGGATCDPGTATSGGTGTGGLPGVPTPSSLPSTSSGDQSGTTMTPTSCAPGGGTCDSSGTATGTSGGTGTGGLPGVGTPTTTTTSQPGTTTTPSECGPAGTTATTGSCAPTGTATTGTTATPGDQPGPAITPSTSPIAGPGTGTMSPGEESVTATGLHMVFTQPVSQSGVPAQSVEHILGEVYVDSLATLAPPVSKTGLSSSSAAAGSSSCHGGGHKSRAAASGGGASAAGGGGASGGGSSVAGGSTSSSGSGSVSPAASTLGSTSQPGSSSTSTGGSLPARFATALRKPVWLLLAYVLWQVLVVGTGVSLWNWRRGGVL
jgi:hypothetical protein